MCLFVCDRLCDCVGAYVWCWLNVSLFICVYSSVCLVDVVLGSCCGCVSRCVCVCVCWVGCLFACL